MIATVTLNPSLDKTVTVHGLVIEETNRWTTFRRDPGGKGINVSRVIHELGGNTIAYSFSGGVDGQIMKRLLRRKKMPFDFVAVRQPTRSNFIITDLKTHHQTRIDAPGPRISATELQRLKDKIRKTQPKPDFIVFAGSVPPGISDDIYRELIEEAKSQGIKTALDSDGIWLTEGIKAKPYLIKPNVHETEELLEVELKDERAIIRAVKRFLDQGIGVAVISRGRGGLIAGTKEKIVKAVPPEVKTRSTVGAGDSALAGLVLKLSQEATLEETCRLAAAAGTAATLTHGTQLCRRSDVEKLLPLVKIEPLHF